MDRLIMIGHTFSEDVPPSAWRRALVRCSYRITAIVVCICGGVLPWQKDTEYDYSEYLGPDYKNDAQPDKVSTITSNHSSWLDIIILVAGRYGPSFASKKSLRKKPIIGLLTASLQSIFINRGASEEQRQQIIQQICHRQNRIE